MGLRDLREELVAAAAAPVLLHPVHGTADGIAAVRHSRDFGPVPGRWGWPAAPTGTDADHAGVVMAEYAPERGCCVPTRSASALAAGRTTARVLARAAGPPAPG